MSLQHSIWSCVASASLSNSNRTTSSVLSRRHGVVATECALTLPILLLLVFASADFGRIAYFDQVICNAARTGADSGATHKFTQTTHDAWVADVRQAVLEEMQNMPGFDESELSINVSTTTDADGLAAITVEVTYPFRTVVAWPGLPTRVDLRQRFATREFR